MHYFSKATGAFYHAQISGERWIQVPDPAWQRPKIRVPDPGWTPPTITVPDPAWQRPVHRMADPDWRPQRADDGTLLPGQFPPILTFEDASARAPLIEVADPAAVPPMIEQEDPQAVAPLVLVPNPECRIPADAVEVPEALYREVIHAHLHEGKMIAADSRGLPVAVDRPE